MVSYEADSAEESSAERGCKKLTCIEYHDPARAFDACSAFLGVSPVS